MDGLEKQKGRTKKGKQKCVQEPSMLQCKLDAYITFCFFSYDLSGQIKFLQKDDYITNVDLSD